MMPVNLISGDLESDFITDLKMRFAEMVPSFVVEVQSRTDSLKSLQRKMKTSWIANGVRWAWLVIPQKKKDHD